MLTTVFDSFGYCRIGRLVAARKPISRISRLTTTASTGRLMKISVKAIAGAPTRQLRADPSPVRRSAKKILQRKTRRLVDQFRGGVAGICGGGSFEIATL